MEKRLNPTLKEQFSPKDLVSDLTESSKETKFKLDRLSQKVQLLETRLESLTTEMRDTYTRLTTKITSSGLQSTKVEALVERHNQIIHAFEAKLLHAQKIMEEQEIQLTNTLAELQQARAEITRLKKHF